MQPVDCFGDDQDHDGQEEAIAFLIASEPRFSLIIDRFGPPPLWRRDPGFATLVRIILEQQVSLASAEAAFKRLAVAIPALTPSDFLHLDDEQLKQIGFSRQKTRYGRQLANALVSGALDLAKLPDQNDQQARRALTAIPGIGPWTANIYLMMALQRPDIWPQGDIALAEAFRKLTGSPRRPTASELADHSERWRPWRSVAARLLYHFYLSGKAL